MTPAKRKSGRKVPGSAGDRPRLAMFVRMASRPVPRVMRMMRVFAEEGFDVEFVGAFREGGLAGTDQWEGWTVRRVGPSFPLLNGRRPLFYLWKVIQLGGAVWGELRKRRPSVVHVSDFEAAIPVLLYGWIHRTPVVYNIHDNLAQRYRVPRLVGALLNTLEGLVVRAATVTLVPEEFRRTALPRWCHSKVEVVRNSPIDPGFADPAMLEDAGLGRILYGGWLDWGRGLRQMVEVVGTTPGLSLDVAGEGNPEIVAFLAGRKGVRYLGYLSHTEILRLTGESGFVSALYDPARPINRLAASNKLAEGLAVGRPVIINSELEIAKALSGYGCLVEAPYLELGDLGAKIVELIGDRERYEGMCRAGRRAYETLYAWEEVREAARRVVKRVG